MEGVISRELQFPRVHSSSIEPSYSPKHHKLSVRQQSTKVRCIAVFHQRKLSFKSVQLGHFQDLKFMQKFDLELQAKVKVMHQKKRFACLFKTIPLDRLCCGFKEFFFFFFSIYFSQYHSQSYFDNRVALCNQIYQMTVAMADNLVKF